MGTYGHLLIQIFSAKTAVCPLGRQWDAKVYVSRWQSPGQRDPPTRTIESQWQSKVEKRKVK
jgi:hypothetical protein